MSAARHANSTLRLALAIGLAVLTLATLAWLGNMSTPNAGPSAASATTNPRTGEALRIGVVPERDIFAQRRRFAALAEYLSQRTGRPINIVTAAAYQDILKDFATNAVDGAFLGSFVTVLAVDRSHARIVAKPILPGEVTQYRGEIIVPVNSPIQSVDDLRGRSIALVRATMAAHLFPFAELHKRGLLDPSAKVRNVWVGTHDEVILNVKEGKVDAGAVKDLRLIDFEKQHGQGQFRRLLTSEGVPDNALVVRAGLDDATVSRLSDAMLTMKDSDAGRAALEGFGVLRFEPCSLKDYRPVYEMIASLDAAWPSLGIDGPAPAPLKD